MVRYLLIMVGSIITVTYPVAHVAVEGDQQTKQPKTYDACVLAASERNTKWSQYKLDVNKCRAEFAIPGEY